MSSSWTFGKKIGAGFALIVAFAITVGLVAIYALRDVVEIKDRLIDVNAQTLIDAQSLAELAARRNAANARFLLTREEKHADEMREHRSAIAAMIERLRGPAEDPADQQLLRDIEKAEGEMTAAQDRLIATRRTDASMESVARVYDEDVFPKRKLLREALDRFVAKQEQTLHEAEKESTREASSAIALVTVIVIFAVFASIILAFMLTRALAQQIGLSVGQVQSSSAELQSSASQQATAAKEQSSAMSEIATTITELLATSRQIAESAKRVGQIAQQAVAGARTGEATVERGQESINSIRRQVDLIVNHMLELGRKSQQIGAVLEIVSELAEQTNILAINATIEAAGAGDSGKRFAVVAEEIRKLADRVGGSTKEIRALIEDVRGAVNTTVMTTESGSKAVDAGAKQFGEVASSFRQIATQVGTTTDATREIELSTKQQTSAVEQVNLAIASVAQATKETEASSSQTLQTASELASLSRSLLQLVQATNR